VLRAHGLHGEVRVKAFAAGAPNLQRGRRVYLNGEQQTVLRARPDRAAWILELDGIRSRTQAEALRGSLIEAPDESLEREEGAYFLHELVGLAVRTAGGQEVGRIVEVLQPGANDVYVVQAEGGREVLVPAIGEVVASIDLEAGVMVITPLAGMLDDPQ
jgi:16S rRNA processing protein RimM